MRKQYSNIALPKDLIILMDLFITKNELGYTSRTEITKEALRLWLYRGLKLKEFAKNKKEVGKILAELTQRRLEPKEK